MNSKNNFHDINYVKRYINYFVEEEQKQKKVVKSLNRVETHKLLSRKSESFWNELKKTKQNIKREEKELK